MRPMPLPTLAGAPEALAIAPFKTQLLKWIGNKQRFAHEIASCLPARYGTYIEPFLGSGAVLATLAPRSAVGADAYGPLASIWQTLAGDPEVLKRWYADGHAEITQGDRVEAYARVLRRFNAEPNARDLLILCRTCYGGVVRFRKGDGAMSTPCGAHTPISPRSFAQRVDIWARRTAGARFAHADFEETMERAGAGDVVYCDPPYTHTQTILYGAQAFSLPRLVRAIERAKGRGVHVALSIDGTKRSGTWLAELPIPEGLFQRELFVSCGRSMLRRFQREGDTLQDEVVADRLLLTY
jgi:DNA adenine methylase